jgi:hypothetical protein
LGQGAPKDPRVDLSKFDETIITADRNQLSIWGELYLISSSNQRVDCPYEIAAVNTPKSNRSIVRCGGKNSSIRREGQVVDDLLVPDQFVN